MEGYAVRLVACSPKFSLHRPTLADNVEVLDGVPRDERARAPDGSTAGSSTVSKALNR